MTFPFTKPGLPPSKRKLRKSSKNLVLWLTGLRMLMGILIGKRMEINEDVVIWKMDTQKLMIWWEQFRNNQKTYKWI